MEREVRYVTTPDSVRIAYSIEGEGKPYVWIPGWISHLDLDHQLLEGSRGEEAVAGIQRITLDKRGTGLSSRNLDDYSHDARIADLEAVVDDIGLSEFALGGLSEGGPIAIGYAARHPEKVTHLVIFNSYANGEAIGGSPDIQAGVFSILGAEWGLASKLLSQLFVGEDSIVTPEAFAAYQRSAADADDAYKILKAAVAIDVRPLLPLIKCPTLVLHCRDDKVCPLESGQELAAGIKGARFVSLPGSHIPSASTIDEEMRLGREFLLGSTAAPPQPKAERSGGFRSILFTDLVGHTEMMSRLGDDAGRAVLREHERLTREVLDAHGGTEVKTMGDGFMASFTSVTQTVECAIALQQAFASRDGEPLAVRVGINAGEPIEEDGDLFGATVILAARIAAKADGGEILVADTVRGLCTGKGFLFSDRGEFVAKGMEEPVRVYEVSWQAS
jgi:class 3 adenylate cyclase/predicted esterase